MGNVAEPQGNVFGQFASGEGPAVERSATYVRSVPELDRSDAIWPWRISRTPGEERGMSERNALLKARTGTKATKATFCPVDKLAFSDIEQGLA